MRSGPTTPSRTTRAGAAPSTPTGAYSVRKARAERTDVSELPAAIACASDELAGHIKEISRSLRQSVTEARSWEERALAMRKLHALLLGGVAGHPSFARLANAELAPPLALQLADNRSKCIKLACTVIGECGQRLGPAFAEGATILLPPLLRLLRGAAPHVVVDSAEGCIRALVQHTRTAGLLPPLIAGTTQRSAAPQLRCACVRFVGEALGCYEADELAQHTVALGDALGSAVADASSDVRSAACDAWISWYEPRYPTHAARVRSRLSLTSERLVASKTGGGSSATTPEAEPSKRSCSSGGSTGTPAGSSESLRSPGRLSDSAFSLEGTAAAAVSTTATTAIPSTTTAVRATTATTATATNATTTATKVTAIGEVKAAGRLRVKQMKEKARLAREVRDAALSVDQKTEQQRRGAAANSFDVQIFAPVRPPPSNPPNPAQLADVAIPDLDVKAPPRRNPIAAAATSVPRGARHAWVGADSAFGTGAVGARRSEVDWGEGVSSTSDTPGNGASGTRDTPGDGVARAPSPCAPPNAAEADSLQQQPPQQPQRGSEFQAAEADSLQQQDTTQQQPQRGSEFRATEADSLQQQEMSQQQPQRGSDSRRVDAWVEKERVNPNRASQRQQQQRQQRGLDSRRVEAWMEEDTINPNRAPQRQQPQRQQEQQQHSHQRQQQQVAEEASDWQKPRPAAAAAAAIPIAAAAAATSTPAFTIATTTIAVSANTPASPGGGGYGGAARRSFDLEIRDLELESKNLEIEATRTELDSTRSDLEAARTELESTRSDLEAERTELVSTRSDLEAARTELYSTRSDLEAERSELVGTRFDLARTGSELDCTRSNLEAARTQLEATGSELEGARSDLESARRDLALSQHALDANSHDMDATIRHLSSARDSLASAEADVAQSQKVAEVEARAATAARAAHSLARKQMAEAERALERVKTEVRETSIVVSICVYLYICV